MVACSAALASGARPRGRAGAAPLGLSCGARGRRADAVPDLRGASRVEIAAVDVAECAGSDRAELAGLGHSRRTGGVDYKSRPVTSKGNLVAGVVRAGLEAAPRLLDVRANRAGLG